MSILEIEQQLTEMSMGKLLAFLKAFDIAGSKHYCRFTINKENYFLFQEPARDQLSIICIERLEVISKLTLFFSYVSNPIELLISQYALDIPKLEPISKAALIDQLLALSPIPKDNPFSLHPFSGKVFLHNDKYLFPLYWNKKMVNAILLANNDYYLNSTTLGIWHSIYYPKINKTYLHSSIQSLRDNMQKEKSFHILLHKDAPLEVYAKLDSLLNEKQLYPLVLNSSSAKELIFLSNLCLHFTRLMLAKEYSHELIVNNTHLKLTLYKEKSPLGVIQLTKALNDLLEQLKTALCSTAQTLEDKDKAKALLEENNLLALHTIKQYNLTANTINVINNAHTRKVLAQFLINHYSLSNYLTHETFNS